MSLEVFAKQGLATEKDYPYVSGKSRCGNKCNTNVTRSQECTYNYTNGCSDESYYQFYYKYKSCDFDTWQSYLDRGPLAVVVDAGTQVFQSYRGGVFSQNVTNPNITTSTCTQANHAVTAVGWGKCPKTGKYYTLIRNSWGETWGSRDSKSEYGHIKMEYQPELKKSCFVQSSGTRPNFEK